MKNRPFLSIFVFIIFLLLLLLLLFPLSESKALCPALRIINIDTNFNLNLNPRPLISVEVARPDFCGSNYYLSFSRGRNGGYDRYLYNDHDDDHEYESRIPFQLYRNFPSNSILKYDRDIKGENDTIGGSFPAWYGIGENRHTFRAVLSVPFNPLPAGTYTESIQIELYQGAYARGVYLDRKMIHFTYTVPKVTALSIVRNSAPFDYFDQNERVDFGDLLKNGKYRDVDLRVLSNAGYEITFNSKYGSKMKHENKSVYARYKTFIDGREITLLQGISTIVSRNKGVTSFKGDRVRVHFKLDHQGKLISGHYSDTITVNVTSTL